MPGIDIPDRPVADAFLQAPQLSWTLPSRAVEARRRAMVRIAKYALPVAALILLSSIAMWPEIARNIENSRVAFQRLSMVRSGAGQMLNLRYHGMDGRDRPYTVSADAAERAGPERLNLTAPIGDVSMPNGSWIELRAKKGVFIQHSNQLDLADAVTLYRQDGTFVFADTATMNLKQGAATSNDYTHAEGPFGTLDAEGFTLVDKGAVIQFRGPAKLVLNGAH
jgi:lipopolysaccharide export system protein LptC